MNTPLRKAIIIGTAVLSGVILCTTTWFLLYELKASEDSLPPAPIQTNVETPETNTQQTNPPTFEEKVALGAKAYYNAAIPESKRNDPSTQQKLDLFDSPEFHKYTQENIAHGPSYDRWFDLLESQGQSPDREVFQKLFHKIFPTGTPEDYEPNMRLAIAKLFIEAEPIDFTDPIAAHRQRTKIYYEFMKQDTQHFAWLAGQFDSDWMGVLQKQSNPALSWLTDIQQNAATIVANAQEAKSTPTKKQFSNKSWDMSSIVETNTPTENTTAPSRDSDYAKGGDIPHLEPPSTDETIPPVPSRTQLETTLKQQFSADRFNLAMDILDQYGNEEGLRRLRQSDPDFAKQIDQYRREKEIPK